MNVDDIGPRQRPCHASGIWSSMKVGKISRKAVSCLTKSQFSSGSGRALGFELDVEQLRTFWSHPSRAPMFFLIADVSLDGELELSDGPCDPFLGLLRTGGPFRFSTVSHRFARKILPSTVNLSGSVLVPSSRFFVGSP